MKTGLLCLFEDGNVVLTIVVNPDDIKETFVTMSLFGIPSPTLVVDTDAILAIIMEAQNGS